MLSVVIAASGFNNSFYFCAAFEACDDGSSCKDREGWIPECLMGGRTPDSSTFPGDRKSGEPFKPSSYLFFPGKVENFNELVRNSTGASFSQATNQ